MKTFVFLGAVLALVCASSSVNAHDAAESKRYTACMAKSGDTTAGMIECVDAEFMRQDGRLNKAYKALVTNLTDARKTQLQKAQRIWITYRDANCGFYNDPDGGSMARVSANNCMLTMTTERASELESLQQ
jgi:uncharacterized protein YecT (DUF1311 family)